MLRAVFSWGQGFSIKNLPIDPAIRHYHTQRTLSTNSAIRRGIRKSRPRVNKAESNSRYEGDRRKSLSAEHGLSSTDRQYAAPREQRPNHQQGLDVEDVKYLRRQTEGRQTGNQKSKFSGAFSKRYDPSPSFSESRREPSSYRNARDSSYDAQRGSSRDSRRSFTESFKSKEYAPQGQLRTSQHYIPRRSPDTHFSRIREDASREQLRSTMREDFKEPPTSTSSKGRKEEYLDQPRTPGRYEVHRTSSSNRTIHKPPNRAERRRALHGPGDTAPGGIPRSEVKVEENGKILRSASKLLRTAVKLREQGGLSEPGLDDDNFDSKPAWPPHRTRAEERDSRRQNQEDPWRVKENIPLSVPYTTPASEPFHRTRAEEHDSPRRNQEEPWRVKDKIPLSIPYTTPASEFLYGTSVIFAALTAMRRKIYKLYVYDGENREASVKQFSIQDLARDRKVEVIKVEGEWLRIMDKLSAGRPHNGYILEASPLPKLPVTELERVLSHGQESFSVCLDHQSAEDEVVNGTENQIKFKPAFSRYPFVLLLDGILDPGNLGAVLRTAFFLGVDAVAITSGHSAPLTPVALKASAGACESLPLLFISNPFKFVHDASNNGWKVYAAVAPPESESVPRISGIHQQDTSNRESSPNIAKTKNKPIHLSTTTLGCPTREHPCLLMLGSEGDGIRKPLLKKAEIMLSVAGRRGAQNLVDSLNVSVAAGLLCEAFLRPPPPRRPPPPIHRKEEEAPVSDTSSQSSKTSSKRRRSLSVSTSKKTIGALEGVSENSSASKASVSNSIW